MLPILISIGTVKIYSYGVCLAIGLFISLYFWWKMGRDEHFDEIALFDGFFLSTIIYFFAGRLAYVLLHYSELGTLYRFLAILAYPGINEIAGIVAASIFIWLFAREKEWQVWRVADAYVVALSAVLVFGSVGSMLNIPDQSWYRAIFPIAWSIVTFGIVGRVRKDFRFYAWYKGESSMAQEGLASLIFGILIGVYFLLAQQYLVGVVMVMLAGYLIYSRIGRRDTSLWGKLKNIIRRK